MRYVCSRCGRTVTVTDEDSPIDVLFRRCPDCRESDTPTPPCVVCGAPGAMGVGHSGRNDELWYCIDRGTDDDPAIECSLLCVLAEGEMA
ncbi:MAG TPA: hypothetical protein VKE25_07215 [Actinomycetes bacterium]|nr:hypothetical protein [Actinomycetes bacterium]